MTVAEFRESGGEGLSGALLALWLERRGEWERAHEVAQEMDGPEGAWVHAFLHRKEGDTANAAYWYRRAGRPVARGELDQEWVSMVGELLARQ